MKNILVIVLTAFPVISAITWTSNLTEGGAVSLCSGENLTLPWTFTLDSQETLLDIVWYYEEAYPEEVVATSVAGHFLVEPKFSNAQYLPNAGFFIPNAYTRLTGAYKISVSVSDRRTSEIITYNRTANAYVSDLPTGSLFITKNIVLDRRTEEWHLQLSCGSVRYTGVPSLVFQWTLPYGFSSTYYPNNNFSIPNPIQGSNYICRLGGYPASCLPGGSPLLDGITIHIDPVEERLALLEAELHYNQEILENFRKYKLLLTGS